jgi:hypothetical protein
MDEYNKILMLVQYDYHQSKDVQHIIYHIVMMILLDFPLALEQNNIHLSEQ